MKKSAQLCLFSGSVLLLAALTTGLLHLALRPTLSEARREYTEASRAVQETTERREELEEQFRHLQTRVDSVEYRARLEYRMIRPGERLLIVREGLSGQ